VTPTSFLTGASLKGQKSTLISQAKYAQEVVDDFGHLSTRKSTTPADSHVRLGLDPTVPGETLSNFPYRQIVGSLFYLTNSTRPDLSFAVCQVSRFQANYGSTEVTAVKRII
jgi:hypothetical protein